MMWCGGTECTIVPPCDCGSTERVVEAETYFFHHNQIIECDTPYCMIIFLSTMLPSKRISRQISLLQEENFVVTCV